MILPLRAPALAFVLLASAAFAQLGPPPDAVGAPMDLASLSADVRAHPTNARSVNRRFGQLTASLRASGARPSPQVESELTRIRALLGEGKLTPAARLLDGVVAELQKPGPAAAAPAAAAPEDAGPDVLTLTPVLLDSPQGTRPAQAYSRPVAGALGGPSGSAVPAASAPAAPEESSWRTYAALAGGAGLLAAVLVLGGARRSKPATARVKIKPLPAIEPLPKPAAPGPDLGPLAGKYALGRTIASGGMGEVYEGRDLTLGRRVAIKRMLSDFKLDAGLRAQFLSEARTVAKISHPYIVPIHECLESGGDLYLVFEFVEGETVAARLEREARLPLKECRRILRYVGEAIEHAHKNHVLHRDLKPANIMLDVSGIARVMDFGIALESTRTAASAAASRLDTWGTVRYMPPEQHYGKSVRASDIYAMGVCLYEMATGHPPYAVESLEELIAAKRARRYPAPTSLRPELSKEFDLFVAAALEPDPQHRISSAREFLEGLDAIPA
jgi:tRNA A-37 threonylcarbamoyl transferase component Bud32